MAINNRLTNPHTADYRGNSSFDSEFQTNVVQPLGFDGQNLSRMNASDMQIYWLVSAPYTYVCFAAVGTPLATAKWKVFRVDSGGTKMYADANANYDNVASDPAGLTYSFS